MSQTRSFFLSLLRDSEHSPYYASLVRKRINDNMTTRMFDDFNHLLSNNQMSKFKKDFIKLFNDIPITTDPLQDPNCILTEENKKAIEHYQRELIQLICHDILDDQGEMQERLIQLLDCEDFRAKLNNGEVICAYVGAVNHLIILELQQTLKKNTNGAIALTAYLNPHYGEWVRDEIRKKGHEAKFSLHHELKKIAYLALQDPSFTFSVCAGLAAVTTAGLLLFGLGNKNKSNPIASFQPLFKPK